MLNVPLTALATGFGVKVLVQCAATVKEGVVLRVTTCCSAPSVGDNVMKGPVENVVAV